MIFYIILAFVAWFTYTQVLRPLIPLLQLKMRFGKEAKMLFFPVLGEFFLIGRKMKHYDDVFDILQQDFAQDKYKIRLSNFFGQPAIAFTDPEYYRQILLNHENYTKFDTFRNNELMQKGLLFSGGKMWQDQRQLLGHPFKADELKNRIPMFNEVAKYQLLNFKDDNIIQLLQRITGQVVIRSFFGNDLAGVQLNGYSPEIEITKLFNELALLKMNLFVSLKQLILGSYSWKILLTKHEKQLSDRIKNIKQLAIKVVKERQENFNPQKDKKDLLDLYIDALNNQDKKHEIAFEEIVDQFITLFFAGTDTTSNLSASCLYYLAKDQEAYNELLQEVDRVVGKGDVQYEHLPQLKTMQAFINETLRLRSPAVTVMKRVAKCDHNILDIPIKKGWLVGCELYYQFRQPEIVSDPLKFDYKRWLREDLTSKNHSFAYIPFSAGPRNCIGQHMAQMETKIILCQILKMFNIKLREGVKIGWTVGLLAMLKPDNAIVLTKKQ